MRALGFGAVLWDDIDDDGGDPASPSIVGEKNIGGAVFNVIVHLQKLGYAAYMLSAIGNDALGEKTFAEMRRREIYTDFVSTVMAPTCLIKVTFDDAGLPHYSSPPLVSWDQIRISEEALGDIARLKFDFLVYGTLEQRSPLSRATLRQVLEQGSVSSIFVDLTLRGGFYSRELLDYSMRKATIAKMNDEEALVVNDVFGFGQKDLRTLVPIIAREFDNDIVCITLGSRGALIGDRSTAIHKPAYSIEVKDTVGCGDAFSAGLLYMLGKGASIDDACDFGNKMGALISSKRSSIPLYSLEELDAISAVRQRCAQ